MYFDNFPLIAYDSVGDGETKVVTHLLKRVAIRSKVKTNVMLLNTYDIKGDETPEILADQLYNDSELHWVILLINDITDRYHQWPMNNNQFLAYMNDKYTDQTATHHYEISQVSGDTTIKIDIGTDNTDHPAATAYTNYEYEEALQDELRKIKILDPIYVERFVIEYEKLIGES
jgi:hypothetical protein